MGVLGAVSKGAAMVFPGEAFDAEQTLDTLAKEKCTALYGVPTMFVAMLQELDKRPRDLSTLRTGIMAGAPCCRTPLRMGAFLRFYRTAPRLLVPKATSVVL